MNFNEKNILRGFAAAGLVAISGGSVDASQPSQSEPHPIIRPSLEGIPSANAVAFDKYGQPVSVTMEKKSSESSSFSERALEPGSNFRLDLMKTSLDGNVTIGIVEDFDGKQHLVIGDRNATFGNAKEFNWSVASIALNKKNPQQMAVAGSIGRGRDIGMVFYTVDGGATWVELDGSKLNKETTGGLKGIVRNVQFIDGFLEIAESSGDEHDRNAYVARIPLFGGKIQHRKVEGDPNVTLLTNVSELIPIDKKPGEYTGYAYLYPTGGIARVYSSPDSYIIQRITSETSEGIPVSFNNKGDVIAWSYRNLMPGIPPNSGDRSFGTIQVVKNETRMRDSDFQIPQELFPDADSINVLGIAQVPDEDSVIIAVGLVKGGNDLPKLVKVNNASVLGPRARNSFQVLDISGWPTTNGYINKDGIQVFRDGNNTVYRVAFGWTQEADRGMIVDVVNNEAKVVGYIGNRQTQQILYKHKVFAAMAAKKAATTSVTPR